MANKNQVATLTAATLINFLGGELAVMRSDKAKKYPLYLRTKIGPMAFNTPAGQDFLLENGVFHGPEGPDKAPGESPEQIIENPSHCTDSKPDDNPVPEPEKKPFFDFSG